MSAPCHSGAASSNQVTGDVPSWRSRLQTLPSESEGKLKTQQQQITSANYGAGKYVKSILPLNSHLKSLIQMGLNVFLIKG